MPLILAPPQALPLSQALRCCHYRYVPAGLPGGFLTPWFYRMYRIRIKAPGLSRLTPDSTGGPCTSTPWHVSGRRIYLSGLQSRKTQQTNGNSGEGRGSRSLFSPTLFSLGLRAGSKHATRTKKKIWSNFIDRCLLRDEIE